MRYAIKKSTVPSRLGLPYTCYYVIGDGMWVNSFKRLFRARAWVKKSIEKAPREDPRGFFQRTDQPRL